MSFLIKNFCNAPNRPKAFKETFLCFKPGGILIYYDWVMIEEYDSNNAEHVAVKERIEVGNVLPILGIASKMLRDVSDAEFKIIEKTTKDLVLIT